MDTELAPRRRIFSTVRVLFVLLVVLPTMATLFYTWTTPAPFYLSQVQFAVEDKSQSSIQMPSNALASMGIVTNEPDSLFSLRRFLHSQDALTELEQAHGFKRFYAPDLGDWLTALPETASTNQILRYYRWVVTPHISTTESIMTLDVWAYEPQVAQSIAQNLLRISENFLNRMNARSLEDQVAFYRNELDLASVQLATARADITKWRNKNASLDPQSQAETIQQILGGLEVELANLRAEIRQIEEKGTSGRTNPLLQNRKEREASLLAQIEQTRSRLGGENDGTVAALINKYETLATNVELAENNVSLLMAALENARQAALQQQKYLLLISSPTLNDVRIFPRVGFHTLLAFVVSLLVFGVATLLYVILRDYRRS